MIYVNVNVATGSHTFVNGLDAFFLFQRQRQVHWQKYGNIYNTL